MIFTTIHGWWRRYRDWCDPPVVVEKIPSAFLAAGDDVAEPGIVEVVVAHASGRETMVYIDESDLSVALAMSADDPVGGLAVERTTMVCTPDGQSLVETIQDRQRYFVGMPPEPFDQSGVWDATRDFILGSSAASAASAVDTPSDLVEEYGYPNTLLWALAAWATAQASFGAVTDEQIVEHIHNLTGHLEAGRLRHAAGRGFE